MDNLERDTHCKGQTPSDEYLEALKSNMPHLSALFDNLSIGITPNFLDMMYVLEEIVAFSTKCDQFEDDPLKKNFGMSEKKCRFCY